MQVHHRKKRYRWRREQRRYGDSKIYCKRASDGSDSELEGKATLKAFLSEKQKYRAMKEVLQETPMGMSILTHERELARLYEQKRGTYDEAVFNRVCPPYKFSKKAKRLRVRVRTNYYF